MKQVPTHSGRCLVVFHGFWLEEEKNLVEVAFRVNEKTYDEWGFFRGRNLYTAWRFAEKNILVSHQLLTLIEKVVMSCETKQKLFFQ